MTLYYLLDGPPKRLVKIEAGVTSEWRDGKWEENELLYSRATGIGGDALSTPISAEEAERFIAAANRGERFVWTEDDLASGGVRIE